MDACLTLLAIVVMLGVYQNKYVCSMNIDTSRPTIFSPAPPSSRFGFSLAVRENGTRKWLFVGAPRANSTYQPSLIEPGALYRCDIGKPTKCDQVPLDIHGNEVHYERPVYRDQKDHQFLSSAISVSPGGDKVVACAPSWAAIRSRDRTLHGMCYLAMIVRDDIVKVDKLQPLLVWDRQLAWKKRYKKWIYSHALGQTGMAAHFAQDGTLLMGSPGLDDWSGTVVHSRGPEDINIPYGPTEPELQQSHAYLGYAVSSGHYLRTNELLFVAGAPRFNGKGQVLLYKPTSDNKMAVEIDMEGHSFGSYFGATLCTSDVNQDGFDDLLVGAPSEGKNDQGAVHVFLGGNKGGFEKTSTVLRGNFTSEARFGSSIASAGDLNQDGYPDVIVGAPYEDSHAGAVYIYNGGPVGLQSKYSQRISLVEVNPRLQTFGFSLAGGLDVDGNGYPDIAVGAYASDTVVMLRSRPVVDLCVTISTNPSVIPRVGDRNNYCPGWQQQHALCLQITVHFHYEGHLVPDTIAVNYTLTADILRVLAGTVPRATLHPVGARLSLHAKPSSQRTIVIAKGDQGVAERFYLVFQRVPRDILTPVVLQVKYELSRSDTTELEPVLIGSEMVQRVVQFDTECGRDERCITDLVLCADAVTSTGTSHLAFGDPAHLKLHLTVENNGDPAYVTEVMVKYPSQLHFIGTSKDDDDDRVTCRMRRDLAQDYDSGPGEAEIPTITRQMVVLCEVGNPIRANTSKEFGVLFDPSDVRDINVVEFEVLSSTLSEDVNEGNNNITLLVPMHYAYSIDAKGLSSPEQLYVSDQSSEKLVHQFEVVNRGPGVTPEANVKVDIPVSSDRGELLSVMSVQIRLESVEKQTIQCKRIRAYPQTPVGVGDTVRDVREVILDCFHAKCVTYLCGMPSLGVEQHAAIYVNLKVTMTTLEKYEDAEKIVLTTRASIEPVVEGVVNETTTHFVQASTPLHPLELPSTVQWWIIGAAVGGGLLIFLISVLVMYKLGFFRRTELDELKKLVSETEGKEEEDAHFGNTYSLHDE